MRHPGFLSRRRRAVGAVLALGAGLLLPVAPARAVTAADADAAFRALNRLYWNPQTKYFRRDEKGPRKADFWFAAQLWDTVMDEYERAGGADVRRQIDDVYDGFNQEYPDWTRNKYNDDIMWWTIACARAYALTGEDRFLKKAKTSFDYVYDHFADDTLGGGVYWTNERRSKNSCINGPAAIAAVRLSMLLKDATYLDKAKKVFAWQTKNLTDGNGKVFDSIRQIPARNNTRVSRGSLTYNQGTYIGAAVLLYRHTGDRTYLDDAVKAAQWTRDHLCVTDDHILRNEGQGDAGAFKGIFVRYMKLLINQGGRTEFLPWMRANADSAWRNRRRSDDIMGNSWTAPPLNRIQSQTAASAVTVVVDFAEK